MKNRWKRASAACSILLLAGVGPVWAGSDDPTVTHPQVMVVFDNSGSMDGCGLRNARGRCIRSRFTAAQEVLTGTFQRERHLWPSGSCPEQDDDGVVDWYTDLVHFGLGSFDDDGGGCRRYGRATDAYGDDRVRNETRGRGIKGRRGGDSDTDRCDSGNGCLIDLVDPDDPNDLEGNNTRVQDEICGMRFNSCTPIAGSLYDARYYFEHYEAEIGYTDPMGPNGGNCRPRYVLLMTDGEEYRPCFGCPSNCAGCPNRQSDHYDGEFCAESHGGDYVDRCSWYGNEAWQAWQLFRAGVPVYVVAFGNMDEGDRRRMHRIARAGMGMSPSDWWVGDLSSLEEPDGSRFDEPKAFIVSDAMALKLAFAMILDSILAGSSSRTVSSTTPSSLYSTNPTTGVGGTYEVSAWFEMGISGITWNGFLARDLFRDDDGDGQAERIVRHVVTRSDYTPDDDEILVRLPDAGDRRFLTIVRDPRSKDAYDDQAGAYNLPRYENAGADGLVPFHATSSSHSTYDFDHSIMCLRDTGEGYTTDELARVIKAYVRGQPGTPGTGRLRMATEPQLGDIFHSSPVVVPPPSALTPDYRYEAYFREHVRRHTMVYVGANDGLLHAFVVEDNDSGDGVVPPLTELWAFMPYRILSTIQNIRNSGHSFFVDGTPVVSEVLFPRADAPDGDPTTDECLRDNSGGCIKGAYRTVLIAGLRGGGDAYFALDVTDPDNPGYLWEYRTGMAPDDGDDRTEYDDYEANQCRQTPLQTWAKPIIGQVWLKRGSAEDYVAKNVVVLAGGYVPRMSLSNLSSCVQLMQATTSATALHVLDIETGELLRRFSFTGSDNAHLEQALEAYYEQLEDNPNRAWNHWGQGNNFETSDFDMSAGTGWQCSEMRNQIQNQPLIPDGLLEDDFCEAVSEQGNVAYRRTCCVDGNGRMCRNLNGNHNCSYQYTEYQDGGVEIWLKTTGCRLVDDQRRRGKLHVQVGGRFSVESVAASPVGYNLDLGEFLSRLFIVTSRGRVWRVNMRNGQYEESAPEGERVVAYANDPTKDWTTDLWFDPLDSDFAEPPQPEQRPVTATPSLALNYERNLVLYFGTGSMDDLEFKPDEHDYFYAVEEKRDVDDPYLLMPTGSLVDRIDTFAESERLYSQPLVVGGNVYFVTFTPDSNVCGAGLSRVYGRRFDNFDPAEAPMETLDVQGLVSGLSTRWGSTGVQVVMSKPKQRATAGGQGEDEEANPVLGDVQIKQFAQVLHWGQVL